MVSLLMDTSSEMIHAVLPVYLVVVLGASALTVGIIEGIAESAALLIKVFSGVFSDKLGRRKPIAALGYGVAALSKPIFPLASTVGWIVVARLVDRLGKGIRGAPRDTLVADLTPENLRGASFGLRQALDTVGAVIGPLLALVLLLMSAGNFAVVLWVAVVPALLSFVLILVAVHDPKASAATAPVRNPISRSQLRRLGSTYWWTVAVAAAFSLARFSEAFLLLKAQAVGLTLALIPAALVLMSLAYAAVAYSAGALSDRMGRSGVLAIGIAFLIAADFILANAQSIPSVAIGILLWGLHLGFSQGVFAALVADTAPAELRGTAFGVFNLVAGVTTLLASLLAGALWVAVGPAATFLAGAALAALAMLGVWFLRKQSAPPS
jgi:MFS family permease